MKKITMIFAFTFLAMYSTFSYAAPSITPTSTGGINVSNAEIEYLLPSYGAESVFVMLTGVAVAELNLHGGGNNCATTNTGTFTLDISTEGGQAVYASLLLAHGQDREIFLSASDICEFSRQKINWVLVR